MLIMIQVLTGATTSFGAHLLSHLDYQWVRKVKKVYCLIPRRESHDCLLAPGKSHDGLICSPYEQVYRSLQKQDLPRKWLNQVEAIFADTGKERLGLDEAIYKMLCENVTMIIDAASVGAFYDVCSWEEMSEEQQLSRIHNLVQFSLDVRTASPAPLFFIAPSTEDYESLDDPEERVVQSPAATPSLALSTRTIDKTKSILISATRIAKAKTFTVHVPKVFELPIQKEIAEKIAPQVLDYILHDTRGTEMETKVMRVERL